MSNDKKLLFSLISESKANKILSWTDLTNKAFTKFAAGQLTEAVTIGGNAFGLLGMLLSVPVVSVIYFRLRHFVNRRLKERNIVIDSD